jgi:poly [ADP-ribose] polymerase
MVKKSSKKKIKKEEKHLDDKNDKNKKIKKILTTKKKENVKKQNIKIKKSTKKQKIAKKSEKKEKDVEKEKNEEKDILNNSKEVSVNNEEVELDQAVEDRDRYIIVEAKPLEYQDKYYAITFNYTNVKNNNNKFYIIQLLQDVHTKQYGVLFRWGRVGKFGQIKYTTYNNFEEARSAFLDKVQRKIEYGYIQIKTKAIKNKDKIDDEESKNDEGLEKPIANLLKLVFDLKSFNKQMQNIGYDSDKIPLGQLSSEVIKEGYNYLNQLEKIIEDSNNSKYSNKIYDLSSSYYTLIPHNFGMYHMSNFVINSLDMIKKEHELLDSIKNFKIVSGILHSNKNEKNNDKKEISLKEKLDEFMYDIKYLPKEDINYSIIEQYLMNSNYIKNSPRIKLNEVFKVEEKKTTQNKLNLKSNKKLLWYGVSISNFANIFKNGMELPSPEAPIFSYMFGKGMYFSDVAIKSFYNSHPQNNVGLMLLCEVELGNVEERFKADIKLPQTMEKNKNSIKVIGMNYPDESGNYINEEGIIIPTGRILVNQDSNKKSYFDFNEYIVYNLSQIKIKYITKVQFES